MPKKAITNFKKMINKNSNMSKKAKQKAIKKFSKKIHGRKK